MDRKFAIIITIVLILAIYYYYVEYKYGYNNTAKIPIGTEVFNVHREHPDKMNAAKVLAEVTRRNSMLLEHLEKKYEKPGSAGFVGEPTKNNRIDVIPGSDIYYSLDPSQQDMAASMRSVIDKEQIQERVSQLLSHYNAKKIFEISPMNRDGVTSYTEDKKILILCLRKKEVNSQGEHELHDINTIMFVVLHELSHMMNKTWGHPMEFWELFKFMLINGIEAGIYTPIDYSKYPINYCGLLITYNPVFDPSK